MAYDAVADELGGDTKLSELDSGAVALAREYAKKAKRKWPPRPSNSGWTVYIQSVGE
jgi:hypothetical protein